MNKVILNPAKILPIIKGHPFIFPKAIQSSTRGLVTGELVEVYDPHQKLLGVGVYNDNSLYRIRLLHRTHIDAPFTNLTSLIKRRFMQAKALRISIDLPNGETTGYRFFNSEADGLSGLTVDIYGEYAVVLSSAYWVEAQRELISELLLEVLPNSKIIWRSQAKHLSKDGWLETTEQVNESTTAIIRELGLAYKIEFAHAQKSGFYFDQRDNRALVRQLAQGKRVLDICCYSGGFALNAALGGAQLVHALDSSAAAIALAQENVQLNSLSVTPNFIHADAKNYLVEHNSEYDLIILDPPKLSPKRGDLHAATRYYYKLNELAIQRIAKEGGLLLTCSCSAAMTAEVLAAIVHDAANQAGRAAKLLSQRQAALDHPRLASFPEGDYLTALLFYIK